MKIAITGYEGKVGRELSLQRDVYPMILDITDPEQVAWEVTRINPDMIIHCAAMTNVDDCEVDSKSAFEVNVRGTANLLDHFSKSFIYLSTDHVFDGKKYFRSGYSEKHSPNPINIYGLTKYMGEAVVRTTSVGKSCVVRTSKLFSLEDMGTDLERLSRGEEIEFTNIIHRSFLHVSHFVEGLLALVNDFDRMPGTMHIAGTEKWTYYRFWNLAARMFGYDTSKVLPRNHEIEATPRPFRGGLDLGRARKFGIPLFGASDGIEKMWKSLNG